MYPKNVLETEYSKFVWLFAKNLQQVTRTVSNISFIYILHLISLIKHDVFSLHPYSESYLFFVLFTVYMRNGRLSKHSQQLNQLEIRTNQNNYFSFHFLLWTCFSHDIILFIHLGNKTYNYLSGYISWRKVNRMFWKEKKGNKVIRERRWVIGFPYANRHVTLETFAFLIKSNFAFRWRHCSCLTHLLTHITRFHRIYFTQFNEEQFCGGLGDSSSVFKVEYCQVKNCFILLLI